MPMFRAMSTRRSPHGYEPLVDDHASSTEPELSRSKSLSAKILSGSKKIAFRNGSSAPTPAQQVKKASKIHPFFSLFETSRKKKATAKPEFSRYLEYVKEGGVLDLGTNVPVILKK